MRAVYTALREHTHAAELGFKAEPLVVSGLSAGGNLTTAALLYPLLQVILCLSSRNERLNLTLTSRRASTEAQIFISPPNESTLLIHVGLPPPPCPAVASDAGRSHSDGLRW